MAEWGTLLNGIYLSGGSGASWQDTISICDSLSSNAASGLAGCLNEAPDGLHVPGLRTEDAVYAQRDGYRMFNDWYEGRTVMQKVTVCPDGCPGCHPASGKSARQHVQDIAHAYSKECGMTELVIYTDCHLADHKENNDPYDPNGVAILVEFPDFPFDGDTEVFYDPEQEGYYWGEWVGEPHASDSILLFQPATYHGSAVNGPFGVVGRPRGAEHRWIVGSKCAEMLLRFDSPTQLLYILDECGTPGYQRCVDVPLGSTQECLPIDMCFTSPEVSGVCFTSPSVSGSVEPTEVIVRGTECAYPTLTLIPGLTGPVIFENMVTGDFMTYADDVVGHPVVINTFDGTAVQNGVSKTYLLGGSTRLPFPPGTYQVRAQSASDDDLGSVQMCWRDAVIAI